MRVLAAAAQAMRDGRRAAMVTVIHAGGSTPRGSATRMLVYGDGSILGTIGGGAVEHTVIAVALEVIDAGEPRRWAAHLTRDLGMCCGGKMEVYVEPLVSIESFVCFGAGHVARALVPILRALDFEVTVVDDRDELLTEDRFPGARRLVTDPVAAARELRGDPNAYWLIVTHDHAVDQEIVEALLPVECAWLGMIGSRGKVARFLVRYRAAGLEESLFSRLSAPVGLDLGAQTPAEIAVSIAAEIVRVRRGSTTDPIPLSEHPLDARGGDGRATAPRLRGLVSQHSTSKEPS